MCKLKLWKVTLSSCSVRADFLEGKRKIRARQDIPQTRMYAVASDYESAARAAKESLLMGILVDDCAGEVAFDAHPELISIKLIPAKVVVAQAPVKEPTTPTSDLPADKAPPPHL